MKRWMGDRSVGRLALGGLLALLVVDVLLVALAFRPDAAGASAKGPTRAAATSSATPSPTSTASPSASLSAVPLTEVIAAADGKHAWRASLGTCSGKGAALSSTDDGGRTWNELPSPAPALGRVQPVAAERGFVIGVAKDCSPAEFDTRDGAKTWTGPVAVEGGWSRVPGGAQPALVITPKRADARPCDSTSVVDLARVSSSDAVAVCADGRIVRSDDGGSSWSPVATVAGTLSVSARAERGASTLYVVRTTDQCQGVDIARVVGGAAKSVACVKASLQDAEGRVSLSVVGDGGWLSVAGTTWRSGGDLASWSTAA